MLDESLNRLDGDTAKQININEKENIKSNNQELLTGRRQYMEEKLSRNTQEITRNVHVKN